MYLDHDHCERKNIRFFAICPLLVQYLWRSPSGVMDIASVVQVLNGHRKTKIRDPCVTVGIHKDILLDTCQ